MNRQELINILTDFFTHKDEVLFAYIFGPYAKKKNNKNSGIDIVVYIDEIGDMKLQYRLQLMNELQDLLNTEVDLIVMNKNHPVLLHGIFKYGLKI